MGITIDEDASYKRGSLTGKGYIYADCLVFDDGESHEYEIGLLRGMGRAQKNIGTKYKTTKQEEFSVSFSSNEITVGRYMIIIDGDGWAMGTDTIDFIQNTPYINWISVDGTTVTINWRVNDRNIVPSEDNPDDIYSYAVFEMRQKGTSRWYEMADINGNTQIEITANSMTSVFNVDRFNTEYEVYLYTYVDIDDFDDYEQSDDSDIETFKTEPLKPWTWTQSEKGAFNGNGLTNILTASRWKEFCGYMNGVSGEVQACGYGSGGKVDRSVYLGIEKNTPMKSQYFIKTFQQLDKLCSLTDITYSYPRRCSIKNRQAYLWKIFYWWGKCGK